MKVKDEDIESEFEKRKSNATEDDVKKVLEHETKIKEKSKKGPLAKFLKDIELMFSMVKDYWKGSYREISWGTIASIVAALLYVFSSIDLIPDFFPVVGLLDDAALVALCLKLVSSDLEKYKKFKEKQQNAHNSILGEI